MLGMCRYCVVHRLILTPRQFNALVIEQRECRAGLPVVMYLRVDMLTRKLTLHYIKNFRLPVLSSILRTGLAVAIATTHPTTQFKIKMQH